MEKKIYAIKFNNDTYFIGNNCVSKQLIKARFYDSLKRSQVIARDFLHNLKGNSNYIDKRSEYISIESYQIIEVKIEEIKPVY